jgi:hypothetical protein
MNELEVSTIKTQCDAYLQKGYPPEKIITAILSNSRFIGLPVESKDLLVTQITNYLSAPRSVAAVVVPQFPIAVSKFSPDGTEKQIINKFHPANLKYLICDIMKLNPELNLLKRRIYLAGKQIEDFDVGSIRNRCREYGLADSKEYVIEVLEELALANKYHPFLRSLENVTWDGHDHITDLFNTLTLSSEVVGNRDFLHSYMRRWLIAVCKKVVTPGSQNLTLTFKSKQGDGKSRWLTKLASVAPEIYGEGSVNVGDKDHDLRHLNYLIWHIPEIDGSMRKSDAGLLKDYLTKEKVNVRGAYARFETTGDSVLSFFASVNAEEFLVDDTGARRFLVIELDGLDANHTVNVAQVWAQAMAACLAGEKYYFDQEEIKTINELNGSFETKNHVHEILRNVELGNDWVSGVEIFALFLGKTNPSGVDLGRLGSLFKRAKIESKRVTAHGTKTTVYKIKKPLKPLF